MATPEPFRYYSRNMLLALIIGCVVGLLLGIVPFALIASINDTTSGHTFLVVNDWLGSLSGIGILLRWRRSLASCRQLVGHAAHVISRFKLGLNFANTAAYR